jgi:26S proteasome subunit RPN7
MNPTPCLISLASPSDIIDTICQRYRSEAKFQRLYCVAKCSAWMVQQQQQAAWWSDLETHAYEAMAQHLRSTGNTQRYRQILRQRTDDDDEEWMHTTDQERQQEQSALSQRLSMAQTHLNKDAIRQAYLAQSEFELRTVTNLPNTSTSLAALHIALRARDYCTNIKLHVIPVGCLILELAILLSSSGSDNYQLVREYVPKMHVTLSTLANTTTPPVDPAFLSAVRHKVFLAHGLERLHAQDYDAAKHQFLAALDHGVLDAAMAEGGTTNTTAESKSSEAGTAVWDSLLVVEDVVLYAVVLVLATCTSRQDIARFMSDYSSALDLLVLSPNVPEALVWYNDRHSQRKTGWEHLMQALDFLSTVDPFLAPHWPFLQKQIRENTVAYYWQPYTRIALETLYTELGPAILFGRHANVPPWSPPVAQELAATLADLVRRGVLPPGTRLDLRQQVLIRTTATTNAPPANTQHKFRVVTREVLNDAYASLLRCACLEHELALPVGGNKGGPRNGPPPLDRRRDSPMMVEPQEFGGDRQQSDYDFDDVEGGEMPPPELAGDGGDADSQQQRSMVVQNDDADVPTVDGAMNPEDLY